MAGILTVRTAFYSPTMTAARPREKSLVNGCCFVLRAARRRVIIELSPGEPETTPNTTPGASYVPRKEPAMTATTTAEFVRNLQHEATEIGRDHGWTHAAFVDAYGGDPHAEPDVPSRFATVAAFYTTAYADGVTAYADDTAED
jgi:hypothetical protein